MAARCAVLALFLLAPAARASDSDALRDAPAALPAWGRLPIMPSGPLDVLARRLPGTDLSGLRELGLPEARALLDSAAARGLTPLDVFTDPVLQGEGLYYLGPEALAALDREFDMRILLPLSGKTVKGEPFAMQAMVMGRGRVEYLYEKEIVFRHPVYTSHGGKMRFKPRVVQTIEAPGRAWFTGVTGPWGVTIKGLLKVGPDRVRAVTSIKDEVNVLHPVCRR